jgi:hypothetical protein
MGQSVPKRWHIKFRRWGITQKKAQNKDITLPTQSQCGSKFVNLVVDCSLWLSIYGNTTMLLAFSHSLQKG